MCSKIHVGGGANTENKAVAKIYESSFLFKKPNDYANIDNITLNYECMVGIHMTWT